MCNMYLQSTKMNVLYFLFSELETWNYVNLKQTLWDSSWNINMNFIDEMLVIFFASILYWSWIANVYFFLLFRPSGTA